MNATDSHFNEQPVTTVEEQNEYSLFIVEVAWNSKIHRVGKMQILEMAFNVVHIYIFTLNGWF